MRQSLLFFSAFGCCRDSAAISPTNPPLIAKGIVGHHPTRTIIAGRSLSHSARGLVKTLPMIPTSFRTPGPRQSSGAVQDPGAIAADGTAAAQWQRTLRAMVGIQSIMTMAFSVLSPIMPLLLPELGVETPSAVDLWSGILNGVTSFVAALLRRRGGASPTVAGAR
jgi:hypothetical protein